MCAANAATSCSTGSTPTRRGRAATAGGALDHPRDDHSAKAYADRRQQRSPTGGCAPDDLSQDQGTQFPSTSPDDQMAAQRLKLPGRELSRIREGKGASPAIAPLSASLAQLLAILPRPRETGDRRRRFQPNAAGAQSSIKAHSAAICLTTSSAVKTGGISEILARDLSRASQSLIILCGTRTHGDRPVIPDLDIWRAATLMLKRYGEKAQSESAKRADELAADGDHDGAAIWRLITDAVAQLANTIPSGPVH
jgi:hypothetical protein